MSLRAGEAPRLQGPADTSARPGSRTASPAAPLPTPSMRHAPPRGTEAPASEPAQDRPAPTCLRPPRRPHGRAARFSLSPRRRQLSALALGVGCAPPPQAQSKAPPRPAAAPPRPEKPGSYWLLFPPFTLRPAPGTAREPSRGEPPPFQSARGPEPCPADLTRPDAGRDLKPKPHRSSVPTVLLTPRRWT